MNRTLQALLVTGAALFTQATLAAPLINLNSAGYYTYGNVNSYSLPLAGISVQSTRARSRIWS